MLRCVSVCASLVYVYLRVFGVVSLIVVSVRVLVFARVLVIARFCGYACGCDCDCM